MPEIMTHRGNWLLNSIEPEVRATVADQLREVDLSRGQVLQQAGQTVDAVYFPEGALIGLMSATPGGDTVQTAMLGWDGALGVFEACGTRRSAFHAEVQVAGSAWRLPASDYRELFGRSERLRENVHKYVELLLTEARQHVACNALHSIDARLSRSVLEALERATDGRTLPVTQEVLAEMLGVQRTSVTAAVADLQRAGALRAGRGVLEVLEAGVLEQRACCCREAIQEARHEIYASDEEPCET